jgi:hypothetical protein
LGDLEKTYVWHTGIEYFICGLAVWHPKKQSDSKYGNGGI